MFAQCPVFGSRVRQYLLPDTRLEVVTSGLAFGSAVYCVLNKVSCVIVQVPRSNEFVVSFQVAKVVARNRLPVPLEGAGAAHPVGMLLHPPGPQVGKLAPVNSEVAGTVPEYLQRLTT